MKYHHRVAWSLITTCLALVTVPLLPTVTYAEEPPPSVELIPIPNAVMFDHNVLLGGQPSQEHLKQAAAAGYQTIVNLRPVGEFSEWDEREVAEAAGLRYVSIPISGNSGLSLESAQELATELDRDGGRPILIHCASGNRAGALLALKAFFVDFMGSTEALQLGLDHGMTSLEPTVDKIFNGEL